MKMIGNEVLTSAELMKEFFAMSERMINNISEKVRYEKICEYLIDAGAKKKEKRLEEYAKHEFLELEGDMYLIPTEIFDELDESWIKELEAVEEDSGTHKSNSKVAS
ncbi:hypothetical protein [Halanaerobacter jeridensis]|uniref:Uncharacterized protein n=1 Tax=Halanaerobacter jeridensis TaxID=706427 RepID=A0A938XUB8_9FIRM|nr:hypothetical protein [Halanaerobacter jeridensis]MBM7557926.1 hypothetical protein [Halanaerobacter jeridensis]